MSSLVSPGYIARPSRADNIDTAPDVAYPYLVNGGAYDDEFEGGLYVELLDRGSLNPKWTRAVTAGGLVIQDGTPPGNDPTTLIDPYSNVAAQVRYSHNRRRTSWYMVQPSSGSYEIRQSGVVFPADCFMWARMSFSHRYNAVVNNDCTLGITMSADLAGAPDHANEAYVFLNESDTNIIQGEAGVRVAGVTTNSVSGNVGPVSVGTDTHTQVACYIGIQRRSTNYDFWLGWPNSTWMRFTPQTAAFTPTWITVGFSNATNAAPGYLVQGIDFIRLRAGVHQP